MRVAAVSERGHQLLGGVELAGGDVQDRRAMPPREDHRVRDAHGVLASADLEIVVKCSDVIALGVADAAPSVQPGGVRRGVAPSGGCPGG